MWLGTCFHCIPCLAHTDTQYFLRKEWGIGGRKKERNVMFLIKMGIIPSYTISMKNLDLTFIISSLRLCFFQNITHGTRQKQKLKWFSKASEWSSDRSLWILSQTHLGSTRFPWETYVRFGNRGYLWYPDFSQNHLGKREAHPEGCSWTVSSKASWQGGLFHPIAWLPSHLSCHVPYLWVSRGLLLTAGYTRLVVCSRENKYQITQS